jgi:S1-C subfamily serine protease
VWRHPAELAAEEQVQQRADAQRRRRERVILGVSAALTGAGLTLVALAAIGELSDGDRAVAVATTVADGATPTTSAFGNPATTDRTLGAVARVRARNGGRTQDATGLFLPRDGFVLTQAAPIDGASEVVVQLDNGVELPATVLGLDAANDVAVLRVAGQKLPSAVLGDADTVEAGDTAFVLRVGPGSRAGVELDIATVVATGRRVEMNGNLQHGLVQLQFEAGTAAQGIVLSSDGRVVGVAHGQVGALGYAETIDWIMRIADDLMDDGTMEHAWLGLEGADVRPDDSDRYGAMEGARVVSLGVDSPAAVAGLEIDDIIIGVDNVDVRSMSDLVVAVRLHRPGDEIELRYLRNGTEWRCRPSLIAAPSAPSMPDPSPPAPPSDTRAAPTPSSR